MEFTYNDLAQAINRLSEEQKREPVKIGFSTGIVTARSFNTNCADSEDLDGTVVIETGLNL